MNYYGANQAMYNNAGYNYYELSTGADGFYVRDYSGYNGGYDNNNGYSNYGDYGNFQANYPQYPQYFPLQQPVPPRERTPTPPPPPAEPSPEYLATSLAVQPNTIPPGQRKLLIFDLNGTLLLRSPRHIAGQRKIYLRPYARALVAFIAHPQVRAWLDCMVWSSAQAHNVREMVERVFGAGEGAGAGPILRAVWARDTLGLGREAFHQKTQTTKDLAKPWAFFAAPKSPESEVYSPTVESLATNQPEADLPPSSSTVPTSSPPPSLIMPILHWPPKQPSNEADTDTALVLASTSAPQPPSDSASNSTSVSASQPPPITIDIDLAPDSAPPFHPHGPQTTLLVDDSPLKARLQPWNHLCVGEYDAPTRARDRSFARLPPDADSPSSTSRPPHANGVNGVNGTGASGSGHGGGKYRKALDAELAGLAEEESATAANGIVNGNGEQKVRKERWRKRRKEEAAAAKQEQQQDGADGTLAMPDGEVTPIPPEASTSADANVAQDAPASSVPPVQNPSKRSRRRERKRRQAEAEAGSSDGAQSSPAQQPAVDEPASASGSSSPSLSPSLPPPAVDVEARDELKSEGVPPPISPPRSDGESKKRKREPDAEEESGEVKHKDTATATIEPPPMPADGEPYDPTLLAVIGVLSHVRSVGNVAAWVRSGGLAAIVDGSDAPAAVVQDAQIDTKEEDGTAKEADAPTLTSNPSQWFTSRRILVAWAARGRAALAELGIDATPGVQ